MTAAKTKSVPARLADEIEALGWQVDRQREGTTRTVAAMRGEQRISIIFERKATTGAVPYRDVFSEAWLIADPGGPARLRSAAHALSIIKALPFALDAPDEAVLAAVAGRRVEWLSRISGKVESGHVPRGGVHLKLISGVTNRGPIAPEDRVLSFADAAGLGFRSVRIGAIVKVV